MATARRFTAIAASGALVLGLGVAACGQAPSDGVAQGGQALSAEPAFYPRLIRLQHQAETARNGQLLVSATSEAPGKPGEARFFVSTDGGQHFSLKSRLRDPDWAPGLCCGSVFELPQAVGPLPAGTLLYSASVGQNARRDGAPPPVMRHPIYASNDGGATWRYLSECGRGSQPGGLGSGVWEPEFALARDGRLVCYFADETLAGHSQQLRVMHSRDGVQWSEPRALVATRPHSERPGMPVVRRLASGRYLLVYEHCSTARPSCEARAKWSDDGIDFGPADEPGRLLTTADGTHFRHTPTVAVAGNGTVLLMGQILFDAQGRVAPGNGRTMMVNTDRDAQGAWRSVAAPLATADAPTQSNWCQNYSTPLLPGSDGRSVLAVLSNWVLRPDGQRECHAWLGQTTLDLSER